MVEVYLSVINGQLCELVSVGEDGGNEEQKNGETCLGDHLGVIKGIAIFHSII